ncbi:MAG: hypothetical protein ACFWUC_13145 [Oscillospiraceae bacterium]
MEKTNHAVYAKTNDSGYITAVNSDVFLSDLTGWTQIDEGTGDKYAHAQGNYFDKPLIDENGCYNYKLVDGEPVETTDEEKQAQIDARPASPPTPVDVLGQQLAALSLSDAQKNILIAQMGSQLVQAQLDIAALKGGAAS